MPSVAIEISDREVRCLWFDSKRGIKLKNLTETNCDRIPIPTGVIRQGIIQDTDALAKVLMLARQARGAKTGTRVFLALPWAVGMIRTYRLPWFSPRQRAQALHYVIEEDMPIPEGNLAYAYRIVAEKKQDFLEVLAGAVRRTTLDGYVLSFEQAGFELERVDLAVTALAGFLPLQEGEDVLCLYPQESGLDIALFQGLKPTAVRNIAGGDAQGVLAEFERMLLYRAAQHPEFNLKRVWCFGREDSGTVGGILEHLGPSVIKERVPIEAKQSAAAFRFAPAAFAMVWQVSKRQQGLNLWPLVVQRRRQRKLRLGGGLAVLTLYIMGSLIWLPLQSKVGELEREISRLRVDGTKRLEKINRETALLKRWNEIQGTSLKVGKLLAQIEAQVFPGIALESLEIKQGLLYLRASAREAQQVEALMRQLSELGWERPALAAYMQEGNKDIVFSLTARRAGATAP